MHALGIAACCHAAGLGTSWLVKAPDVVTLTASQANALVHACMLALYAITSTKDSNTMTHNCIAYYKWPRGCGMRILSRLP